MTRPIRDAYVRLATSSVAVLVFTGAGAVFGLNPGLAIAATYFSYGVVYSLEELTRELWGDGT